jgi:hypothetical protein
MSFRDFMNDAIEIERGDRKLSYDVSFQGKKILGPVDMEVEEDDGLTRRSTGERFVITDVERHNAPSGMRSELSHCVLTVVPESQAGKRLEAEKPTTNITQHIGTAHAVAGRDIHGTVDVNVTVNHVLDALADAVGRDEAIPSAEKTTILGHLKTLATNPYVLGVAPPLILEALKKSLGL